VALDRKVAVVVMDRRPVVAVMDKRATVMEEAVVPDKWASEEANKHPFFLCSRRNFTENPFVV
jgi:hypothetical protein